VLQPDGLFLASMFAGDTAQELRRGCQLADEERLGGISSRNSPLIHVGSASHGVLTLAQLGVNAVDQLCSTEISVCLMISSHEPD
jgi:NADH dehydrogenase [ubiquinone] 1 alpha subcomplex assembly factor 5